MSIEGILVGLLAIVIGAAWAFYGLKLFTILLPIWAFFFGLLTGGPVGRRSLRRGLLLDGPLVGDRPRLRAGARGDLVLLVLRGDRHPRRRRRLFARRRHLRVLRFGTGVIALVVGLILGALFAIGTFLLGVPVLLVMVLSAFSGAAAIVNGVLILFNQIPVGAVNIGIFGSLFHQRHRRAPSRSS